MADYPAEFVEFLKDKNINLDNEKSKQDTVKGFVRWLMINDKEVDIDAIQAWGIEEGYLK